MLTLLLINLNYKNLFGDVANPKHCHIILFTIINWKIVLRSLKLKLLILIKNVLRKTNYKNKGHYPNHANKNGKANIHIEPIPFKRKNSSLIPPMSSTTSPSLYS